MWLASRRGSAIGQLAVGDLQIAEVDEVPFAASQPLERHEIGKRADRCLHAIDSADLRSR
jgi:hypothetical protein